MILGKIFFHCDKVNRNLRGFSQGTATIEVIDGRTIPQDMGEVALQLELSYQVGDAGPIVHSHLQLDRATAFTLMGEICRAVVGPSKGPT